MTETSARRFPLPLFLQLQWRASGAVRSLKVPHFRNSLWKKDVHAK